MFVAVYGTAKPTRSQESSMERAVRVLRTRGLVDGYGRWICRKHHKVIIAGRDSCCDDGRVRLGPVIGRPRTAAEQETHDGRFAPQEIARRHRASSAQGRLTGQLEIP